MEITLLLILISAAAAGAVIIYRRIGTTLHVVCH